MKKILITGATGFIGGHCLPLLARAGDETHALSSKSFISDDSSVTWHQVDLLDAQASADLLARLRPTHLLHLAWVTTPGDYWSSMQNHEWVRASFALLKNFGEQGGQRAVIAGSCAEYDWTDGYCSEFETPLNPSTLYGKCKNSLAQMTTSLAEQMKFSFAWPRLFFVYGPHEHPKKLIPSVISSLLNGEPAYCTEGTQRRDFLYVQDLADALVTLLHSEVTGPVNVASGETIAVRDVVNTIAKKLNRKDLIRFGSISQNSNEPSILSADITRLEKELGWRPTQSIESGLDLTIEWWQQGNGQSAKSKERSQSAKRQPIVLIS